MVDICSRSPRGHRYRGWHRTLAGALSGIGCLSCGIAVDAIIGPRDLAPTITEVVVTPSALTLYEGRTAQVTAIARDKRGRAVPDRQMTWVVLDTAVATVSSTGAVLARRAGTSMVTAKTGGVTGSASLMVRRVPVSAVVMKPEALTLPAGQSAQVIGTPQDSAGGSLSGRVVTYATSNPEVATVNATGMVTAVSPGTAAISAASEGTVGIAQFLVMPAPVASVWITPTRATFTMARSPVQLTASTADAAGNPLTGWPVTFSTSDPAVATVSATGLVTAVSPGRAVITGTSEGASGRAALTILESTTGNFLRLESDRGDYIGDADMYEFTDANSIISVSALGVHLSVGFHIGASWVGDIRLPRRFERLQPGTYTGLERYPFDAAATGGISWSGESRGCNEILGSVTIDSVSYVADELTGIDLRFEQHCERNRPALRGTLHWRANYPRTPQDPSSPVPPGLWAPPAGATPSSGNYVYLQSDVWDWMGQGRTYLFTEPTEQMRVESIGGLVTVGLMDAFGHFRAPGSAELLQVGYYGKLTGYLPWEPLKGGLHWSMNAKGCNELKGWFAVDAVSYVDGKLTALDLRFVQHCESRAPALRGAIHWRR